MSVTACCLLAAFLGTTVVDAAAGVEGEVAAGRAPVQLTGPEENSLTFTLVPGAALRLRSMTDTLTLTYTPRIFYRIPNALEVNRPLLLHQMTVDHSDKVSRRLTWNSTFSASVGEVDYTASNLVFNTVTSAVRTSVTDIIRLDGQTGFQYELSRLVRWTLDVNADYTRPLGDDRYTPPVNVDGSPVDVGDVPVGGVPESAQVSTVSGLSYAVTRADRVGLSGEITYQWFPDTGRFLLLSPSMFWDKQLSRRTDIGVAAGVAYVVTVEALDGRDQENSFGGTGSFSYNSIIYRARSAVMSLHLGGSLDWFFDPIAGTSQPRAGVDASSNIEVGRDWQITPNASFYTLLRESRSVTGPGRVPGVDDTTVELVSLDATQLRGEIPCSYRISNLAYVNFGVRGSLRGRSLLDEDFSLTELVEFWAFAGLTLRFASGRDEGSWLSM
jgi:hypothetical protein